MTNKLTLSRYAWLATWLSWWVLFLQQTLDALGHQAPWFIWTIKLLPLLLFVRGMRQDNLRSYIWLCFVCLGYFLILVQRLFATPTDVLLILGMLAVVILFNSTMLYVRWRAQELRNQSVNSTDDGV